MAVVTVCFMEFCVNVHIKHVSLFYAPVYSQLWIHQYHHGQHCLA